MILPAGSTMDTDAMSENTNRFERIPGVRWAVVHPRLAAWIVLSAGMIILLVIEARDVGLLAAQWLALVVACILVAGACVWIISWEDDDDEADTAETTTATQSSDKPEAAE